MGKIGQRIDSRQTTITDLIQISPEDLGKPSGRALEDNINAKYADKVFILSISSCLSYGKTAFAEYAPGHTTHRPLHMSL